MTGHRAFLASLPVETRIRLTKTRNAPGLARAALHFGALTATSCWIAAALPGWQVVLPIQGILLVFLFTAMHECSHRTAFATRWLNDLLGAVAGVLLVLPAEWFRAFHLAHHRHTQDPARDPELASAKPDSLVGWLWHVSGVPVWLGALKTLFRNAVNGPDEDFVPPRQKAMMQREARLMLVLYLAVAGLSVLAGTTMVLWLWVIPALLGQPFLRLFLLAEHGRCPFVADMFANSRTTTTTRAIRLLTWNMPFHAEHHAMPMVPFHLLPDLHDLSRFHLQTTAPGYAAFTRDYLERLGIDA